MSQKRSSPSCVICQLVFSIPVCVGAEWLLHLVSFWCTAAQTDCRRAANWRWKEATVPKSSQASALFGPVCMRKSPDNNARTYLDTHGKTQSIQSPGSCQWASKRGSLLGFDATALPFTEREGQQPVESRQQHMETGRGWQKEVISLSKVELETATAHKNTHKPKHTHTNNKNMQTHEQHSLTSLKTLYRNKTWSRNDCWLSRRQTHLVFLL